MDLSDNFIIKLFLDSHSIAVYLEILSIKNNTLTEISDNIFNNFNLKILVTDKYLICCKLPYTSMCTSVKLWFESCKHLLLQKLITVYVFCFSILLLVSNVFTTFLLKISHMRSKDNYGAFQYVAISANVMDLSWGIYLITLVVSDFLFENNYILHESSWQSGFTCYFLFSVNLNYNILSPLLSSFLSFSRLMVVMYPLDSILKNKKIVLKCCILMYGLATTIVIPFVITFRHVYGSVPFRLCSPFIDPTHSNMMLRVTTCIVVFLQYVVFCLNIVFNSKTISELKGSKGKVKTPVTQKHSVTSLLTQFSILTVSNTFGWILSGIIFLICMFIAEFSVIMITWVVTAVSGIKSITNPIVFIVTTVRKWKNL